MIIEIGHALLWLAGACALLQAVGALVPAARLEVLATPAAVLHGWLWLWIAACLGWSFWTTDLSVAGVAATTAAALPGGLKLAAIVVQDGGWLVAAAALTAWGGAVLAFAVPGRRRAMGALGVLGVALTAAVLFGTGSFDRLQPAPTEGAGFPTGPRAWLVGLLPPGPTLLDTPLRLGEARGAFTLVAVTPVAGPDSTGVMAELRAGGATLLPEWRETARPAAGFAVSDWAFAGGSIVAATLAPVDAGRWRVAAKRLPLWPLAVVGISAAGFALWRRRR